MADRQMRARSAEVVDLTDGRSSARAAHPAERAAGSPSVGLDDLVHPHDAERLVAMIQEASSRRQDTFVRVRNAALGWIEVRCSFVPVDPAESTED